MKRSDAPPEGRLLGCHLSIAHGLSAAANAARSMGNNALQLFTRNAMGWTAKPITDTAAAAFRESVEAASIEFVVVHALYLANLASPDETLRRRSLDAIAEELGRAQRLGIPWVVMHPGAHRGGGTARAVERIGRGVAEALGAVDPNRGEVGLLLENTAGAGTALGASFSEIAAILECAGVGGRAAACLDTCHAFAAGYDLRTPRAVDALVEAFDRDLGLDRLMLIHLNDSQGRLGSRIDRHEHLGRGRIGRVGLAALLRHPRLGGVPWILETPKEMDGRLDADDVNLAWVRSVWNDEEEP
jgi:deoxyribonuclease-4